jgi:hypothetical protein
MLNEDYAHILKQPAHPGEPPGTPSRRLSRKTKRELDVEKVSSSPFKVLRQLPLGSDPFSQKTLTMKKEEDVPAGRNWAVIVFQSPNSKEKRHIIRRTDGPPGPVHAETDAYDHLPQHVKENKENILAVFTERKPCAQCHRKLKSVLHENTEVLHNDGPRTPTKARQRENEAKFQEEQAAFGVRIARQKKPKSKKAKTSSPDSTETT